MKLTSTKTSKSDFVCRICDYAPEAPDPADIGTARGNTKRFKGSEFILWKCPKCETIRTVDKVNFKDIYSDYPLKKRILDGFARGTQKVLVQRLKQVGLQKEDHILDYGCGVGIFLQYLKEKGYENIIGFDPYENEYSTPPKKKHSFDCVIANDVIEHVEDPQQFVRECMEYVKPGGILYIGTTDSSDVDIQNLEPHLLRLHLPFHRTIFTEETLHALGIRAGLQVKKSWRKSYMDTSRPFMNYRFLDEFHKTLGHEMEKALDGNPMPVLLSNPKLFFWAFFGKNFPSAAEPAVVFQKTS